MAVLTDLVFEWNATDYSSDVVEASLEYSAEEVDDTVMGDSTRSMEGGLKNWSGSVTVLTNESSGGANADLFADIGTTATIKLRKDSGSVASDNPNYTGTALLTSESNPTGGAVGDSQQTTFNFVAAGDLSRATT